MKCDQCNTQNRSIAQFCKECGTKLPQSAIQTAVSGGSSFDDLVGLDTLKSDLSELQEILQGMKINQSKNRYPYNMIIIGASGTAKSVIPTLLASCFHKYGMITNDKPTTVDGSSLVVMDEKTLDNLFSGARGGMLFVDNAHKLVDSQGEPTPIVSKFIVNMDKYKNDPLILLAGLPFGLREFIKAPENTNIISRFQKIHIISDYTPAQFCAITEHELKKEGFTFKKEVSEHLLKRFRYLYKERKKKGSNVVHENGHLAIQEANNIKGAYYKRKSRNKEILKEDITGEFEEKKHIQDIMKKLDEIIGMDELKKEIKALYTQLQQIAEMEKRGVAVAKPTHHFIITGNPGTGKTTVARLLGEIFEGLGLLDSGHVVEVDRSKLVAGFVGQTAPLTNKVCDSAMGGILFIDEAYALKQNDNDNFGQECIDTLLKRMEDDRGRFMVVVAGYKNPMEKFLTSNPGLKSRFTKSFDLKDYSPQELTAIFEVLAKSSQYIIPPETKEKVTAFFKDTCARKTKDFANGREARNLMDEAMKNQASRLSSFDFSALSKDDMVTLLPQDIPVTTSEKSVSIEDALKDINELVGLTSIKEQLKKIADTLEAQKLTGETEVLERHFVFSGNPGTGKTTVARILGDVFKAIGLLPTNNLIEVDRSKMVASFVGQTAPLVNTQCDNAMGGILFIDEAYDLVRGAHDSFGLEAVATLLKRMEDDRGRFIVIAAGYTNEMNDFLVSNSGFKSRFTDYLYFDDYNPNEMYEIFRNMSTKKNIQFGDGFEEALRNRLQSLYTNKTDSFANARTVRQLFDKTRENTASRVMSMKSQGVQEDVLKQEIVIMRPEDLDMTVSG